MSSLSMSSHSLRSIAKRPLGGSSHAQDRGLTQRRRVEVTVQHLSGIVDLRHLPHFDGVKSKSHHSTNKKKNRRWNWLAFPSRTMTLRRPTVESTSKSDPDPTNDIVATVGFTGTVDDTRVTSSMICPYTGLAVVQSERMERQQSHSYSPNSPSGQKESNSSPLDDGRPYHSQSNQLSFTWSSTSNSVVEHNHGITLPHATLLLRGRDPMVPTKSLPAIHANAQVLSEESGGVQSATNGQNQINYDQMRFVDSTDTATTATDLTEFPMSSYLDDKSHDHATVQSSLTRHSGSATATVTTGHGENVIWSALDTESTLPDIIEMRIRIHDPSFHNCAASTHAELHGIAYLVLFGHPDDVGKTIVLDLPVKAPHCEAFRQQSSLSKECSSSCLKFSKRGAFLRVKICLFPPAVDEKFPDGQYPTANEFHSAVKADLPAPLEQRSSSFMAHMVETYLAQIRENEKAAREYCQSQKRAMDVYVPNVAESPQSTKQKHLHSMPILSSLSVCQVMWSWDQFLSTLHNALHPNLTGGADNVVGDPDENGDAFVDYGFPNVMSDASTIATSDSMDI